MKTTNNFDETPRIDINLKGVSKFFETEDGTISALQNVSMTIQQGDCLLIHGMPKSGKTTLLKILAGRLAPDKGSCFYNELDFYNRLKIEQIEYRRSRFAYLPKKTPLLPTLTLEENITLPLFYLGIPKPQHAGIIRRMLEKYNLYGKRHLYPKEAAEDIRSLTAFLQAIVRKPSVLAADDVVSGELNLLLKNYSAENNVTLIYTSNQSDIISEADSTVYLGGGTEYTIQRKKQNYE